MCCAYTVTCVGSCCRPGAGCRSSQVARGGEIARPLTLLLAIIAACAILYVHLFVPGPGNGADFADFYAGSWAEAHGLDPYVDGQLWRAERTLFYGGDRYRGPVQLYTYKNPPPFALLLRPLAALSLSDAYWIWAGILLCVECAAGFLFLIGWPPGPRLLGTLAVACCPASLWGYRVGQNAAFLALGLGLAVWLRARDRPFRSGAALTLGFMKPHLLLPIAAVFVLSTAPARRPRAALGVLGGLGAWLAIAVAFDGGTIRLAHWVDRLRGDTTLFAGQGDVAAVPGLLYHLVPPRYDGAITLCGAALAIAVVAYACRARRSMDDSSLQWRFGLGVCGCLSLLPYEHTSDQIILALLAGLLIRPDGSGLSRLPVIAAAFLATLAPLVLFHDHRTMVFDVLPPVGMLLAFRLSAGEPAGGGVRRVLAEG